jgi:hypothetical protein
VAQNERFSLASGRLIRQDRDCESIDPIEPLPPSVGALVFLGLLLFSGGYLQKVDPPPCPKRRRCTRLSEMTKYGQSASPTCGKDIGVFAASIPLTRLPLWGRGLATHVVLRPTMRELSHGARSYQELRNTSSPKRLCR